MRRLIPTRQHPRFGLLSLRPGTWQSEVQSMVRGESDAVSIARLLDALPRDLMLQQQASAAVDDWPHREAFLLNRGAPGQRDREAVWIAALSEVV
jgi:ABC-type iron transport system FetAB ATPase subunit